MSAAKSSPATQLVSGDDVQAGWRRDAMAATREQRQVFLDAVWEGKNIGDARAIAGLTFEQAIGTMDMNIVIDSGLTLNRVAT